MKKNFNIKDAVLFEFSGDMIDLRGDCELISVDIRPGHSSTVEIKWKVDDSNQQIHVIFNYVKDFIVRGRDTDYPLESGTMLSIAGFSDGISRENEDQVYSQEPTREMNYMSFVMDDWSAILVRADSVIMRRA